MKSAETLVSFGYVGPDEGETSDMIVSDMFSRTDKLPNWIELVEVQFFDDNRAPTQAWKMKDSGVYDLFNFESKLDLPRKGYQCDWPPLIGKIS